MANGRKRKPKKRPKCTSVRVRAMVSTIGEVIPNELEENEVPQLLDFADIIVFYEKQADTGPDYTVEELVLSLTDSRDGAIKFEGPFCYFENNEKVFFTKITVNKAKMDQLQKWRNEGVTKIYVGTSPYDGSADNYFSQVEYNYKEV